MQTNDNFYATREEKLKIPVLLIGGKTEVNIHTKTSNV